MKPTKLLMEEPYASGADQIVILSDDDSMQHFKVTVAACNEATEGQVGAVANEIRRRWNVPAGTTTGHFPGSRVKVLCQDGWQPGTVHKEITDNKLTGHAHGDIITTTTWVVWLDEHKWWRSEMPEHIRKA